MKKLIKLIIVLLLSVIITNCTDITREDFEENDFTKLDQGVSNVFSMVKELKSAGNE